MNPTRVDFAVDLAYGIMIFAAVALIVAAGTGIGIAFGLGVLAPTSSTSRGRWHGSTPIG